MCPACARSLQGLRAGARVVPQIQKVLQGRGFKVKDIKPVLERARTAVQETMGVPLPAAFANIPGGIKVGQALFEEIKQELNKFEVKINHGYFLE